MRTNLERDIGKYSQLWLDSTEWKTPLEIKDDKGKIVAYLINRRDNNGMRVRMPSNR